MFILTVMINITILLSTSLIITTHCQKSGNSTQCQLCCLQQQNIRHCKKIFIGNHLHTTTSTSTTLNPFINDIYSIEKLGFTIENPSDLTGEYFTLFITDIDVYKRLYETQATVMGMENNNQNNLIHNDDKINAYKNLYKYVQVIYAAYNIPIKCFQSSVNCFPTNLHLISKLYCSSEFDEYNRIRIFLLEQIVNIMPSIIQIKNRTNFRHFYNSAYYKGYPVRINEYYYQRCKRSKYYDIFMLNDGEYLSSNYDISLKERVSQFFSGHGSSSSSNNTTADSIRSTIVDYFPKLIITNETVDYEASTCFLWEEWLERASHIPSLFHDDTTCLNDPMRWEKEYQIYASNLTDYLIKRANQWFIFAQINYVHLFMHEKRASQLQVLLERNIKELFNSRISYRAAKCIRIVSRLYLFEQLLKKFNYIWEPIAP